MAELPSNLTPCLAIDAEAVGYRTKWERKEQNLLARVSVVNEAGVCVYDAYVKPDPCITEIVYRTPLNGILPSHLHSGRSFVEVSDDVLRMAHNRIVVGHALDNDFRLLRWNLPSHNVRDTSKYVFFRQVVGRNEPSLKILAKEILGLTIQQGAHDSIEDARVAMLLYQKYKDDWEKEYHWPSSIQ